MRILVEGTTLSEAAIAAHVGIGVATVHAWKVRRGCAALLSMTQVVDSTTGVMLRRREAPSRSTHDMASWAYMLRCADGSFYVG